MLHRSSLFHILVAFLMIASLLGQQRPALAGTTGTLTGSLVETGTTTPIANAVVRAGSPSQNASTTTDSSGHFVFVSLAPDTYTVSAEKDGYDPVSVAGITVCCEPSTQ